MYRIPINYTNVLFTNTLSFTINIFQIVNYITFCLILIIIKLFIFNILKKITFAKKYLIC